MKTRKMPMRMCTGCGEMKPKKELVRVVKTPTGDILLDLIGKTSGRGAYVCKKLTCLQKARKNKRIEKSFSCQIPEDVYNRMEEEMTEDDD